MGLAQGLGLAPAPGPGLGGACGEDGLWGRGLSRSKSVGSSNRPLEGGGREGGWGGWIDRVCRGGALIGWWVDSVGGCEGAVVGWWVERSK